MPKCSPFLASWAFLLILTSSPVWGAGPERVQAGPRTALDRYVNAVDTNYSFRLAATIPGEGYTTYQVEMFSQVWLTTNEVNRPQWQHWLTIVKPNRVSSSTALLFIGGGGNSTNPPAQSDRNLLIVATNTETVVAELRNVPNQPLIFEGETKGRSEDSLIAYTWDKFLRTGDEKWPARLPMTKAAVRAMDTLTAFCASQTKGEVKLDKFFVAGGSKRGWTTWTTAAVDNRVVAIAPFVIDMLNIVPSFIHHFEVYGFYAPAVGDYTRAHIMDWNGTPEYKALMRIEEPFEYRERLTLPKFIINSSGDQFFVPDSSQYYFKELKGVKYLRYVPNADHSLRGSDAWMTLLACYSAILKGSKLPQFSWTIEEGSIRVQTQGAPEAVKLWQATNEKARDFRLAIIKDAWKSTDLSDAGGGSYVAKVEKPPSGWTAFFVELTYPSGGFAPFKFTTDVKVVPDVNPHKYTQPTPPR